MKTILISFLTAFCILWTSEGRAETVTIKTATIRKIEETSVPAQEEGVLTKVFAKDGQEVAAEQELASIDDNLVQLQLKVALAESEVAKRRSDDTVSVRYAKRAADYALADYRRLWKANQEVPDSVSQADLDVARLKWEQYVLQAEKSEFEQGIAGLELLVSKAKENAANEHIRRSTIRAPWKGVVNRVLKSPGDWVKPGDPILEMIRMDTLRVSGGLDAKTYLPENVKGQKVTVRVALPGGIVETFEGTITDCGSTVGHNDEFEVWADLPNRKNHSGFWILRPGMWATMIIDMK